MPKSCSKCDTVKSNSDFGKNRSTKTGLQHYCRKCHNAVAKDYRARHPGYDNETNARRKKTPEYRKWAVEYTTKWRKRNPQKAGAHRAIKDALRRGRMVSMPCEQCGAAKTDAHHDSYAEKDWLNVRWLCRRHHTDHHRITAGKPPT